MWYSILIEEYEYLRSDKRGVVYAGEGEAGGAAVCAGGGA